MTNTRINSLPEGEITTPQMIEAASEAIHDFLDERFPEGAMPGGKQLFADDHLDAEFKHEAGCDELAAVVLRAALSTVNSLPEGDEGEIVERLREPTRVFMARDNDCFQASIATVLGLPLDAVPRFDEEAIPGKNQNAMARVWLAERGFILDCYLGTHHRVFQGLHIACGDSPRGCGHAVVYLGGDLWHDPHPEGGGLIGEVEQFLIIRPIFPHTADRLTLLLTEIERAYRDGHCDGRDLARTGRAGSEDMDWNMSETRAALKSPQQDEPQLTEEETAELVARINANPNLHPSPQQENNDGN